MPEYGIGVTHVTDVGLPRQSASDIIMIGTSLHSINQIPQEKFYTIVLLGQSTNGWEQDNPRVTLIVLDIVTHCGRGSAW